MLRFRLHVSFLCGLGAAMAGVAMDTGQARACGGCFHQPPPPLEVVDTVVTDHRMAFSMSPAQTVLWDQIRYTGNPSEFAWVLPVRSGASIELAQDAWLAALEASTQTVIVGPTPNCGGAAPTEYENGGGGGCGAGFGSSSTSAFGAGAGLAEDAGLEGTPQVQVVSQQVVGPYEAVTVRASQGEALGTWLNTNGFDVPAALQPTIDSFTMAGFDFIALKLRPGVGVQAMQPVRVVTQGADPSLPLRMVAAGVGANVTIELFVLSEGRYHPQNFPDAAIDFSKLAWDPLLDESTYTTLMQQALAANGGTGWLTEFAGPADLGSFSSGANPSLVSAYTSQCAPAPPSCDTYTSPDETADGGEEAAIGADASADAGADDGAEVGPDGRANDGAGDAVAADAPDEASGASRAATVTVCTPAVVCDDLQVAMTGISAGNLWITRLRAGLPASALATDLVLEASSSQVPVANVHNATAYTIPSYNPCAGAPAGASPGPSSTGSCACRTAESTPPADAVAFALAAAGIALAAARRRRR